MTVKKTPTPSGLTITRNNKSYIFKWKHGMTVSDQDVEWKIDNGKWNPITLGNNIDSKAVTVNGNLKKIRFRVRGKGKGDSKTSYTMSAWAEKVITLLPPRKPAVGYTRNTNVTNSGSFSWKVVTNKDDLRPFTRIECQKALTASTERPSSKKFESAWTSAKDSDSKVIDESSATLAKGSRTRWVRIRSVGPAGPSEWVYRKHVYSEANEATITSIASEFTSADGTAVVVEWTCPISSLYPIDKQAIQYALAIPTKDGKAPSDANWTDGGSIKGAKQKNAFRLLIDGTLQQDQALFVRVNTYHDDKIVPGVSKMVRFGKLKKPALVSDEFNESASTVTVTVTHNSEAEASYTAVYFVADDMCEYVGSIPHNQTSGTFRVVNGNQEHAIWLEETARYGDSVATSDMYFSGGYSSAPADFAAHQTSSGTIRTTWGWSWSDATAIELSWSKRADAWMSTSEPSTYTVKRNRGNEWNITELDADKWYVRARFVKEDGDNNIYGPYTAIVPVRVTERPTVPTMVLSENVIQPTDTVTASWAYVTGDGTPQAAAVVCEADISGAATSYSLPIASTMGEQSVVLDPQALGWQSGEVHQLCVQVVSASGETCDGYSVPVALTIAEPIEAAIATSNLKNVTVQDDESVTRSVLSLTALPMTLTATGAGEGGTTTLSIVRANDYHVIRPDNGERDGYEGETIFTATQVGEEPFTVHRSDLVGLLDDGASYSAVVTVTDNYGQSAEVSQDFEVHWSDQPAVPTATVSIEDGIAKIVPATGRTTAVSSDLVDIYRLSADAPELIISDGVFGETYVDPYPAFGENAGYRVVSKTSNGDYITADNIPAWNDYEVENNDSRTVINYNGKQLALMFDISLDTSWEKDFERKTYLGGHVAGVWGAAVTKDVTSSSSAIVTDDNELITQLRDLARWSGICHVRTKDGSSYAADVQLQEKRDNQSPLASFTLTIRAVDVDALDGMTLEQWEAM